MQDKLIIDAVKTKEFYEIMLKSFKAKVVEKKDSTYMKILSLFLDKITPIDNDEFMEKWTTTLWNTIYIPFEVGVPTELYPLNRQITTLIHELTHVSQFQKSPHLMPLMYALDHVERAITYEAEAFSATIEFNYARFGNQYHPIWENYVDKLSNYNCTERDGNAVISKLKSDFAIYTQMDYIQQQSVNWVTERAIDVLSDIKAWNYK